VVDIGGYSIEEHLVAGGLVYKRLRGPNEESGDDMVTEMITKNFFFFFHGENIPFHMGMWKILLGAVSQYSEQ